jgi:hypothetical protein
VLGVQLERDAARRVEGLDRGHQADVRGRVEVAAVDLARQTALEPAHHLAHEGLVVLDQRVARRVPRACTAVWIVSGARTAARSIALRARQ